MPASQVVSVGAAAAAASAAAAGAAGEPLCSGKLSAPMLVTSHDVERS
jgi:hypothetical protein